MIILKNLKLTNFLSHTSTEIKFKDEQHLEISGKSGSGKSSIIEAILFALYNSGRCDNNMSLIKRGKEKTTVTIELVDKENNKEYKVTRTLTKKNKHELDIMENNIPVKVKGIRESQDYIEKNILHSSYLLFINSVLYKQDNQETFVNQNAGKRKDLLLEIISANDYDTYLEKTKDEIRKIKTKQEVILSQIESKQNDIKNNQVTADNLDTYKKEEERLKQEIETLKKQYEELTIKDKQVLENLLTIKNEEEKMNEKLKEVDIKNKREKELNQKIIDLSTLNIEEIKKEISKLNELKIKVDSYNDAKDKLMLWGNKRMIIINETPAKYDYQSEINTTNKQLIDIMVDNTGKCPKCGYIDPEREQKKKNTTTTLEDRLKALQSDFEAYSKNVASCTNKLDELGPQPELPITPEEYYKFKEQLDKSDELNKKFINAENSEKQKNEIVAELELVKADQKDLNDEIEKMIEKINKNVSLHEEQRQIKDDIIKINGKLDELIKMHEGNNQLLGIAEYAAKQIEQSKIELETLQKNLDKDKESLDSLELLKDAFGPNGIKAIVIDYIIPQLEDKVNNILGKLSDFRVKLETQKSGIGEDITLEGLFITIINEVGEELDFGNFSGGERVKISVAINEALAEVSKIGFRILDETIVALDSDSVQNFIVAMNEILLKVKQVVCISHIQEIKNMFDEKITVTKANGDSQVCENNIK